MQRMTFNSQQVQSWQEGAAGFLRWLEDIQPQVPGPTGKPIVFKINPFQENAVRRLLARKRNGQYKHNTLGISWPRRHSKTTVCALLCLWRLTTKIGENVVCLANSERQSMSVGFGLARKVARMTPALLQQIGQANIQQTTIVVPALGSAMRTVSGNLAGLYGEKITVGWVSEVHAAASDEAMQVIGSSLGDSIDSWLLVDSTTDAIGGPLHRLEQLAESGEDPTVCVHRIEYASLDEALKQSPPWIRRDWLKSRAKQLLPATFASQHLNRRQESSSSLFSADAITQAQERLPHPMTKADVEAVAQGRSFVVGLGLDRAYGFSQHGDSTIVTTTAKLAGIDGEEPHFYIARQEKIFGSLGRLIKKEVLAVNEIFGLHNSVFESYNSQDLHAWTQEQGLPCELVHATPQAQQPAFLELHRIVREQRLHFSQELTELASEMQTFSYELKAGNVRFGSDRFHDDRVYSLCWSIYALRKQELASYTIDNISCTSRSTHAQACYLRGGDLILPCGQTCRAHLEVQAMYNQYRKGNVDADLTLPAFFANLVRVDGVTVFL